MISSGITAIATSGDAAVAVCSDAAGKSSSSSAVFINEGAVAGFCSIDNGHTWCRLPAASTRVFDLSKRPRPVTMLVKRIASGTDLASVYGDAD